MKKGKFERRLRFTDEECKFMRTLLLWGTDWATGEFGKMSEAMWWRFADEPHKWSCRQERPVKVTPYTVTWRA